MRFLGIVALKNVNTDKRKKVDLKLSTIYSLTRDHTTNSFKEASLITRADYVSLNIFPRGKTKQSLCENLISTERDSTQRRTIQSQS